MGPVVPAVSVPGDPAETRLHGPTTTVIVAWPESVCPAPLTVRTV